MKWSKCFAFLLIISVQCVLSRPNSTGESDSEKDRRPEENSNISSSDNPTENGQTFKQDAKYYDIISGQYPKTNDNPKQKGNDDSEISSLREDIMQNPDEKDKKEFNSSDQQENSEQFTIQGEIYRFGFNNKSNNNKRKNESGLKQNKDEINQKPEQGLEQSNSDKNDKQKPEQAMKNDSDLDHDHHHEHGWHHHGYGHHPDHGWGHSHGHYPHYGGYHGHGEKHDFHFGHHPHHHEHGWNHHFNHDHHDHHDHYPNHGEYHKQDEKNNYHWHNHHHGYHSHSQSDNKKEINTQEGQHYSSTDRPSVQTENYPEQEIKPVLGFNQQTQQNTQSTKQEEKIETSFTNNPKQNERVIQKEEPDFSASIQTEAIADSDINTGTTISLMETLISILEKENKFPAIKKNTQREIDSTLKNSVEGQTESRQLNSNVIQACIRRCPVTSEYNPLCATNGVTYSNPGRLECAKACGVDTEFMRQGSCPTGQPPVDTTSTEPITEGEIDPRLGSPSPPPSIISRS